MNKFTITAEITPNSEYEDSRLPAVFYKLAEIYSVRYILEDSLLNALLGEMGWDAYILERTGKYNNRDNMYATSNPDIWVIVKKSKVRKPYGKDTYK